jgi:hypothetical protein
MLVATRIVIGRIRNGFILELLLVLCEAVG